jgi:hypothetical protein
MTAGTTAPPQVPETVPSVPSVPAELAAPAKGGKKRKHRKNRRWKRGEPTPRLNKAVSRLQADLPSVAKGQDGKINYEDKQGNAASYGYKYADLASVTDAIKALLGKHGLAYICQVHRDPADKRHLIMTCTLAHESGEERTGDWYVGPADWAAQKLGGRITYGRRYQLGCLSGVVAEHDDDGADDRRSYDRGGPGAAFDQAGRQRPSRNGSGQQGAGEIDKVAQSITQAALRIAADPNKTVADLEVFEKQIAGKGKLDAPVPNPFGDGLVKARDVLREARKRMEADPSGHGASPAADQDADNAAAAGEQDAEHAWVARFLGSLDGLTSEQITGKRPEIAQAVRDKVITPQVATEVSADLNRIRREREESEQAVQDQEAAAES